jgi:hypothetical protein
LRRRRSCKTRIARRIRKPAPMAMPAFAAVERPELEDAAGGGFVMGARLISRLYGKEE